jgi:hypothetical protein
MGKYRGDAGILPRIISVGIPSRCALRTALTLLENLVARQRCAMSNNYICNYKLIKLITGAAGVPLCSVSQNFRIHRMGGKTGGIIVAFSGARIYWKHGVKSDSMGTRA